VGVGRVLLLHPPYADFTSPYHSLSYVAAPLRAAGYEVDAVDINALWFRSVFSKARLHCWQTELQAELQQLDARPELTSDAQARMAAVVKGLALTRTIRPEAAVEVFQSERFYDPDQYLDARSEIRSFESLLEVVYAPLAFFGAFVVPPHRPSATGLVAESASSARFVSDLAELLRASHGAREYVFCGVTFPYSAHLVPGMALFRALAEVFPGVPRVGGGTALADVYKYRRDDDTLRAFAPVCDYFYIGEAERGVVQMAEFLATGNSPPPRELVNLAQPAPAAAGYAYVSLSGREKRRDFAPYDWRSHPPVYDWIHWDLYLSPARRVVYAPSRGCFWNKCTFCDYGLNEDGPTAPVRTMDAEVVVQHLQDLQRQHGVTHVYLAADANSPSFLSSFANLLLERGVRIAWSCQLFLTSAFDDELLSRLERSGLRIASFGLESGSSRVLALMGKGESRKERVLVPVFEAFRRSGIGLQPLYFFGFPGESAAERQETVDLVNAYADVFSPPARGGIFTLLAGSMVARNPAAYAVRDVHAGADDEIQWELAFEVDAEEPPLCETSLCALNDQIPHIPAFERPWAGSIDVLHSQLYAERYGKRAFERLRQAAVRRMPREGRVELTLSYDLAEVVDNVRIVAQMARAPKFLSEVASTVGLGDDDLAFLSCELAAAVRPSHPPRTYQFSCPLYQEL
jgi:anaerobic magnesium-protoporphyrin IX monomethyl ester cyclase